MPARRVTLAEVAQAAGVSSTTASFVLNDRTVAIPLETRQRVLEAAKRSGYRPHAAARALATGRTHRIGIVLNQPESFGTADTYFSEIMAGVTDGALRHNHNLLLHAAHYPDWRALYADILSGASDGVILVGRFASDELTPALLEAEFPTVCLSFRIDDPRCVSVDADNEEGGCLAARHLLDLGHRRFVLLYPGDEVSWGAERSRGVERALADSKARGLSLSTIQWSENGLPSPEWVEAAVRQFQALVPRPTATICGDEVRASLFAEALHAKGISVPADCSVISFNSTAISRRSRPPLTSVWQPLRQIGATGVDALMRLIEGSEVGERDNRLPVRLDQRQSSAPPACGGTWPACRSHTEEAH